MEKILIDVFVGLGGVGLVIGAIMKGVPVIVDKALSAALSNPKLKPIILSYRPQIEAFFQAIDAEVKKDLDQAQ